MDKKTIDTTVTSGSSNLITSGAVYNAINSASPAITDISATPTYKYDNVDETGTANVEIRWSVPNTSAVGSQTATVYARVDSITGDTATVRWWKGYSASQTIANSVLKSGAYMLHLNNGPSGSPSYTQYSITVKITLSGGSVFNKQVIY